MANMIAGQYDSSDKMYSIASHFNENVTGQIETFRIRMVYIYIKYKKIQPIYYFFFFFYFNSKGTTLQ